MGVFLTLMVQCQLGMFDHLYNAFFSAIALSDKGPIVKMLYPLFAHENMAAEVRSTNPIGFAVITLIPCILVSEIAYIALCGLRGFSKIGEAEPAEVSKAS